MYKKIDMGNIVLKIHWKVSVDEEAKRIKGESEKKRL